MEYIITSIRTGEVMSVGKRDFASEREEKEFVLLKHILGQKVHPLIDPNTLDSLVPEEMR